MNTPFWSTDPQILWNSQYLTEIWPTTTMSLQSKLNAVSRLIIYLSLFGYLTTLNLKKFPKNIFFTRWMTLKNLLNLI